MSSIGRTERRRERFAALHLYQAAWHDGLTFSDRHLAEVLSTEPTKGDLVDRICTGIERFNRAEGIEVASWCHGCGAAFRNGLCPNCKKT